MGAIDTAVAQLSALHVERETIKDRLRQLDKEIGAVGRSERVWQRSPSGIVIDSQGSLRDLSGLVGALAKARKDVERSTFGGMRPAAPDLVAKAEELQTQLTGLLDERDKLTERETQINPERGEIVRANVAPAWEQYVKARQNEIEKGLAFAKKVREEVRQYRRIIERREETEETLARLRNAVLVISPGFAGSIFNEVEQQTPRPEEPAPYPSDNPERLDWMFTQRILDADLVRRTIR